MRKLVLTVVVMMFCSICFAGPDVIKTYAVFNNASVEGVTYINTSVIIPGLDKVYGFTVTPTGSVYGSYAGIYDAANTSQCANFTYNLFGESENVKEVAHGRVFNPARTLKHGVAVAQSPKSVVIIEYGR